MSITSKISTGLFALILTLGLSVGSAMAQGTDSVSGCGDVDPDSGSPIVGSQQCAPSQSGSQAQSAPSNSQSVSAGVSAPAATGGPESTENPAQAETTQTVSQIAAEADSKDGVAVAQALEKFSVIANAVGTIVKAIV